MEGGHVIINTFSSFKLKEREMFLQCFSGSSVDLVFVQEEEEEEEEEEGNFALKIFAFFN